MDNGWVNSDKLKSSFFLMKAFWLNLILKHEKFAKDELMGKMALCEVSQKLIRHTQTYIYLCVYIYGYG